MEDKSEDVLVDVPTSAEVEAENAPLDEDSLGNEDDVSPEDEAVNAGFEAANDELAAAIAAGAQRDSAASEGEGGDNETDPPIEDPVDVLPVQPKRTRAQIKAEATDAGSLAKRLKRASKKLHRKHETFPNYHSIIGAVKVITDFVDGAQVEARRRGKALTQEVKSLDRYTVPQLVEMAGRIGHACKTRPNKAALIDSMQKFCKEKGIDEPTL